MRVRVEPHAVERFIQRHAPDLTVEEARAFLEEAWPTAGRMKARSVKGDEQWQLDEPRCVLIVKRDADGTVAIATVLPAQDLLGLPEEAIDWLHELAGLHHNVADAAARVERVVTEPAATSPRKVQVRVAQEAIANLCFQIASADRGARRAAAAARAHAVHVEADRGRVREALRVVLRAIVLGEASDETAIEAVRAIDPGFLSPGFLGR